MPKTDKSPKSSTKDNAVMEGILQKMQALQAQLEEEVAKRRAAFSYRVENGRVVFGAEAKRRQRAMRIRLWAFLRATRPMTVITAPVIYSLIIPFVLLDIFVNIYQAICFPVYGIPKVTRRDYIAVDRHQLAYLNALQKFNCMYCGYCNGLIGYVREVASRTEAYWCPIKHARHLHGGHDHYAGFTDFGDGEGFQSGLVRSRGRLKTLDGSSSGGGDDRADQE